jgi:hypothetical protein
MPHIGTNVKRFYKEGRSVMFDKIIFTLMLSMILFGVGMIAFPIPLLWGMLCLIFIGLFVAQRNQRPR